jgi:hypothetical protein
MKPVVLEFVGGYWGGKTLRTDSADLEEVLLAAACYESCHHGAISEGCAGLSEYAVAFARHHGWPAATNGGWQGTQSYCVTQHRETENEIVVEFTHAVAAEPPRPQGVFPEAPDAVHESDHIPTGSQF